MQFDFLENFDISLVKIKQVFSPLLMVSFAQLSAQINPIIGTLSLTFSVFYTYKKIKKEFYDKQKQKNENN
jgi:hypothetical protein